MINFEKQFDNIESKFKDIENNLNNQIDLDTEKLIKLNKEYAELTPIVETIKKYKSDKSCKVINVPSCPEILAPLVFTIPLQLLAYHVALTKGTDVDHPRNLAKSVTVE